MGIVHRLGKNRAIVTIARLLIEIIFTMLTRHEKYEDENDALTDKLYGSKIIKGGKDYESVNITFFIGGIKR